jgi:2-haloacid dehalogenase
MASSSTDLTKTPPKALTFDIFGTVVNWRKTVTSMLIYSAAAKVSSSSRSAEISPEVRRRLSKLTDESWRQFAQQWRDAYKVFVKGYKPNEDPWRDIDTHHRLSLIDLLKKWGLEGLYNDDEVEDLSLVWHFLEPWPDSSSGLQKLGTKFITSTLSNGNQSLLKDLDEHGNLGFKMLQSSEDFKAYKPHPSTYLGAAKKMRLKPDEVAMVAAHLVDLQAARSCGFKTIYVERRQEEDWNRNEKEYQDAKTWVDMWVTEDEDGFEEVARRFKIDINTL